MTTAAGVDEVSQSSPQSDEQAAAGVVTPEMREGQWGPVLKFQNVPIHVHVLPDGRVLMWGRRRLGSDNLHEHFCTPFIWDPLDPTETADPTVAKTISTPRPTLNGGTVNLFCGGHVFLPDGRLLAVGGHIVDSDGVNQASLYDFADVSAQGSGTWRETAQMNKGRWYPTATPLTDGSVLVLSGSYFPPGTTGSVTKINETPQVWSDDAWVCLNEPPQEKAPVGLQLELFPRAHVSSDGRVFISGPQKYGWWLDTANGGSWERVKTAHHRKGQVDYAPAVMYDDDRIVYIGGGGGIDDPKKPPPTNVVETIYLQEKPLKWQSARPMKFGRRQHNATLLPDGTVLVTGGTAGRGFNNVDQGWPVHVAELWDPNTGHWTELAAEQVDRCYHATAVLLPDATVLSAGGGEFAVAGGQPNDPKDTHPDGQIFRPPYLFRGDRPEITAAPTTPIFYGDTFEVELSRADTITKVTWIRLSSVTHSFNQNQRINVLPFHAYDGKLTITAPDSPYICPPGHYMLFALNGDGVPSVARIVQIQLTEEWKGRLAAARPLIAAETRDIPDDVESRRALIAEKAGGPSVVVGLTSSCPYGLAACWGGAYEALNQLDGIGGVNPVADAEDSTAEVFLAQPGFPPLKRWVEQFDAVVNGRYDWRGVEMTLTGIVEVRDGSLFLASGQDNTAIRLVPLTADEKIQFDNTAQAVKRVHPDEARAHEHLVAAVKDMPQGQRVTVTGPLEETPSGDYLLHVRQYST